MVITEIVLSVCLCTNKLKRWLKMVITHCVSETLFVICCSLVREGSSEDLCAGTNMTEFLSCKVEI